MQRQTNSAAVLLASGIMLGSIVLSRPATADVLVVDRGLPTANLNNAAGSNRSNVAWADLPAADFYGDTFTLPTSAGAIYSIGDIRTWVVVPAATTAAQLALEYPTITLFTGSGTNLTATATAPTVTAVTYGNGSGYQGSGGSFYSIYQLDFGGLNIVAKAGSTVSFGVEGTINPADSSACSSATPDYSGCWFNHASNAALSGSPQDGSDNVMQEYAWSGSGNPSYLGPFDSNGNGWDKSSDINVQVLASVPEPASMALLSVAMIGLGAIRRRRAVKTAT